VADELLLRKESLSLLTSVEWKNVSFITNSKSVFRILNSRFNVTNLYSVVNSVDHNVYFPDATLQRLKSENTYDSDDSDAAFVLTILYSSIALNSIEGVSFYDVLLRLCKLQVKLKFNLIGQSKLEFIDSVMKFPNSSLIISKSEFISELNSSIAPIFRSSDVFVYVVMDAATNSTTALSSISRQVPLDAMSCGCITIIISLSGVDDDNSSSISAICEANICLYRSNIHSLYDSILSIMNDLQVRKDMITKAIATGDAFSIEEASASLSTQLQDIVAQNQLANEH
jgi:hypothetical protein